MTLFSRKISSLIFLFIFSSALIFAQENKKSTVIDIDIVDGKPTAIETDVDSLGFDLSYDDDDLDNSPYNGPSIPFIYFEWMPGFGLYQTFDVTITHYRHEGSGRADTVILTGYQHPAQYRITSNYGKRRKRMHYGVDLGYPTGTPVVAAFDGIVRCSKGNSSGYGNLIVLRHNNGLETYYGHLSKRLVNPGQMVHAGDTIGLGGNTGRSYGSHLHFETRYLGIAFNPTRIIDFDNFKLISDTLFIPGYKSPDNIAINTTVSDASSNGTSIVHTNTVASTDKTYYKVKNGDTLSSISRKYGTSVAKIKSMNGLHNNLIRANQRLRVR
jgi:murein DD-endopeptidase MepM/ murein hydrolase activator NlpD